MTWWEFATTLATALTLVAGLAALVLLLAIRLIGSCCWPQGGRGDMDDALGPERALLGWLRRATLDSEGSQPGRAGSEVPDRTTLKG